jgi:hypothetical protein
VSGEPSSQFHVFITIPDELSSKLKLFDVADVAQSPRGAGGDHMNAHVAYQSAHVTHARSNDCMCISNDMIAVIMLPVKPDEQLLFLPISQKSPLLAGHQRIARKG